jgi:membrane-anchored glycerophosphoryl diester phosphodiesterase (GDPDase)
MEFTFSIRGALKESWELFKKHFWFFVALSAIVVVLNFLGNLKHIPFVISFILTVATFIWSIVFIKFSLIAADGKEDMLSFSKIQSLLPDWKQALGVIGVGILAALLTIGGFILLIIPGIWIAFRLSLSNIHFIDKGEGIRKSLRASWDMTKGSVFWTTVLVAIIVGLLYIVGFVLFGIGILVTYPVAIILWAKFYRAVLAFHSGGHSVVVQPAEISAAPAESQPEHHHEEETPNQ